MEAPSDSPSPFRLAANCLYLEVKVHAGARRNRVGPVNAGRIRVSVTTAPEKGRANKEVIKQISAWAKLPVSSISISSGTTNPRKTLAIQSPNPNELLIRLQKLLASSE